MEIKQFKLSDIKPYPNNPRHNDNAVDAVAASINQFGFKVPIVVDKNMEIVTGHTRYKASKKLGLKTVPCIIADDLTPEQIKAFRLVDNKVGELAEWDEDLLLDELQELDFDFDIFGGFDEKDIEISKETGKPKISEIKTTPYKKTHYLISCEINSHDKIVDLIDKLRKINGVEIEYSSN